MRFFAVLFSLFVFVPLAELGLLLYLSWATHPVYTFLLVIITGIVGAILARAQGWRTVRRIHNEVAAGQMPGTAIVDAMMIFVAGALLLTPGIMTDLFGFSLLIPWFRHLYRRGVVRWFKSHFQLKTGVEFGQPARSQESHDRIVDSYVVSRHDEP